MCSSSDVRYYWTKRELFDLVLLVWFDFMYFGSTVKFPRVGTWWVDCFVVTYSCFCLKNNTLYRFFDCPCFVSGDSLKFSVLRRSISFWHLVSVGFIHQNDSSSFILFNDDNVVVFGEFWDDRVDFSRILDVIIVFTSFPECSFHFNFFFFGKMLELFIKMIEKRNEFSFDGVTVYLRWKMVVKSKRKYVFSSADSSCEKKLCTMFSGRVLVFGDTSLKSFWSLLS